MIYWTLCKWVALIERSFQRRPALGSGNVATLFGK